MEKHINTYTQRNISGNFQYERLLNLHEDFTRILYDFTCTLLSKTTKDIKSTVEVVETNGNHVNLTAFS